MQDRTSIESVPHDSTNPLFKFVTGAGIFATPYSLLVGCFYINGYWQRFNVNIFQFLGFFDIVSSSLPPMLIFGVCAIGSAVVAQAHGVSLDKVMEKIPAKVLLWEPPSYVWRLLILLVPLYAAICGFLLLTEWRWKWLALSVLIAIPVILQVPIGKQDLIPWVVPKWRGTVISASILFVPLSYGFGWMTADDIMKGRRFSYVVESNVTQISKKIGKIHSAPRYLGHVGDFDFFYNATEKIVTIIKANDEHVLTVRDYREPSSDEVLDAVEEIDRRLGI